MLVWFVFSFRLGLVWFGLHWVAFVRVGFGLALSLYDIRLFLV